MSDGRLAKFWLCVKCSEPCEAVGWCKPCQKRWLKENFTNWTSENEQIDKFIQEIQLSINGYEDVIFEWIPYDQFNDIKELSNEIYSARWKNGPLLPDFGEIMYARSSANEAVILKVLDNSHNITNEFLNKIIAYYNKVEIYGMSRNPNTKNYSIIFNENQYLINICVKCGKYFTNMKYKWCKPCQMDRLKENFTNWTSKNKQIDKFIQEMQLSSNDYKDIIFEWIPYNQFNDIKKLNNTTNLAEWKDGPSSYNYDEINYTRISANLAVILKELDNSQTIASGHLNKIVLQYKDFQLYGISQNPNTKNYIIILDSNQYFKFFCNKCDDMYINAEYKWCKSCQINYLKENFANWTSKNKQIDKFIQEIQLGINDYKDIIFEWIPYNQFNGIKKLNNTTNLAEWKDGPLSYNYNEINYTRISANLAVILIDLNIPQNITSEFLNEIILQYKAFQLYGISQNPNTKDYIIILNQNQYFKIFCGKCGDKHTYAEYKWCKSCQTNYLKGNFTNWTSKNKQIDKLIQEMQLRINDYKDVIFEWIPYNQFYDIKEIGKSGFAKVYSAEWKNGPLYWNKIEYIYLRDLNKSVTLKYLDNSQNITNELLNEIVVQYKDFQLYGISQNPDTKDYIIILYQYRYFKFFCDECDNKYINVEYKWCKSCQTNYLKENFTSWTSKNEQIDKLIQEMQLRIKHCKDVIFEWIPYNQFYNIKEIGKGGFAKVYSAKWKNGPLYWDKNEYIRDLNKPVALKCLNDSQNISSKFLNEVKAYSINNFNNFDNSGEILKIYGISQNPSTKDYIMVLQYARGGNFNNWLNNNYKNFNWSSKLKVLNNIIKGLKEIHEKQMIHCDFHTGNILFKDTYYWATSNYISDMGGSCGETENVDKTEIYGVMPYVAPEVLRGSTYTKAADIYSFGMIMYFVATEKQPFANRAHDGLLALDIYKGIRPEINEQIAPKCYIDLMKKCFDSNPSNRLTVTEVVELVNQFYLNDDQFKEAESYRLINNDGIDRNNHLTTHPQAFYTSRLLNPFTENLPKYTDDNSECLDCAI
ncbi:hypothetical protein RclHR1_01230005 [Rhizophagus clarus]|uniref:Protein kinase domain-containing protein n=1 Tax=Rhizophagus clarus TaxID=94130 RepID=A0A2Z6QBI6_9GLOM|nr:hypothetical protein RclHR1_01230005 [Rhizophagus clarus]